MPYKDKAEDRAHAARWRKENREAWNALQRAHYQRRKVHIRKRQALYALSHHEVKIALRAKRRTAQTQAGGSYTAQEWTIMCTMHGSICLRCRKKTKLTADQVIPVSAGGSSSIHNIQPLCKSCNSIKGTKSTDYRIEETQDVKYYIATASSSRT